MPESRLQRTREALPSGYQFGDAGAVMCYGRDQARIIREAAFIRGVTEEQVRAELMSPYRHPAETESLEAR